MTDIARCSGLMLHDWKVTHHHDGVAEVALTFFLPADAESRKAMQDVLEGHASGVGSLHLVLTGGDEPSKTKTLDTPTLIEHPDPMPECYGTW
jgi:hypothetical protein